MPVYSESYTKDAILSLPLEHLEHHVSIRCIHVAEIPSVRGASLSMTDTREAIAAARELLGEKLKVNRSREVEDDSAGKLLHKFWNTLRACDPALTRTLLLKVTVPDGRILTGHFSCLDKQGNLVLSRTTQVSTFGTERFLGVVVVPSAQRVKCELEEV